ncbi:hypothetical protein GQX74_003350 [Glossina fuscipes]|nr:hypothetical protein GQX74_003350 [Glossina fuscipes]
MSVVQLESYLLKQVFRANDSESMHARCPSSQCLYTLVVNSGSHVEQYTSTTPSCRYLPESNIYVCMCAAVVHERMHITRRPPPPPPPSPPPPPPPPPPLSSS